MITSLGYDMAEASSLRHRTELASGRIYPIGIADPPTLMEALVGRTFVRSSAPFVVGAGVPARVLL